MKNMLKKTFAILCVMLFLVTFAFAFPAEDVSLTEKYGYDPNFRYDDEIIAHGLKTTVPQIRMAYAARVRYKPVEFDEDYVVSQVMSVYEVYGDAVSVDQIIEALQVDMTNNVHNYLTFGAQKEVDTSGVFTGSGVVLGENGYIATNSHVVSLGEDAKKELYYYGLQNEINVDIENIVQKLGEYGVAFSKDELKEFYLMIFGVATQNLEIVEDEVRLEVWFPTADGETRTDAARVYEARVVAEGTQGGIDGLTQDTAILKIDAENFVALGLSTGYPELNSKLVSAGFPVAADTPFAGMGSEESTLSITVGNGSVSRLIPIEGTEYQAIGITSTLSGGSSGGPSVDAGLNVEGLNTYINSQDERYGYMIPAEVVKDLSSGVELKQGDLSKTFLMGLQLLQNGYGPAALECFESVARQNPDTPYIENLITLAINAPQNEYVGAGIQSKLLIPIIIGWIALAAVLVMVIVLIVVKKKKKAVAGMPKTGTIPLYPDEASRALGGVVSAAPRAATEVTVPLVTYTPPEQVTPVNGVGVSVTGMVAHAPQQSSDSALRSTVRNTNRAASAEKKEAPSTHSAFQRPSDL